MNRKELNIELKKHDSVFVQARISKTHAIGLCPSDNVFTDTVIVFAGSSFSFFALIQSSLHEIWAWQYSSTMKGDRRYAPRECFQTFPFSQNPLAELESVLEKIGQTYHEYRRQLMLKTQFGLTKTYNQFHNPKLPTANELEDLFQNSSAFDGYFPNFTSPDGRGPRGGGNIPEKEIEKKYGKETLNLWNHLKRTPNSYSFSEAVEGIIELRRLHKEMDEIVLKAYGWEDIDLAHDFYEVDYLPENDRIRYTISPDARKEILKRLLQLNHEIHGQEQKQGKTPKTQKKEIKKTHKPGAAKQLNMF